MKKIFTIILTLIVSTSVFSQKDLSLFYITKTKLSLKECNYYGVVVNNIDSLKEIPQGSKFTIVNKKDDYYIIDFWNWKLTDSPESSFINIDTVTNKNTNIYKYNNLNIKKENGEIKSRYFLLTKFQFEALVKELKAKLEPTVGALVLPVKFRFTPTDFSKDITFSGTGGIKWNPFPNKDISFSFIVGLGVSAVTLDSTSTNGFVTNSEDRAAITALGGVVLQWQFLQLGVFTGGDWLARKNIDNWADQGKPWFGFGIGVSLYSKDTKSTVEGKN